MELATPFGAVEKVCSYNRSLSVAMISIIHLLSLHTDRNDDNQESMFVRIQRSICFDIDEQLLH